MLLNKVLDRIIADRIPRDGEKVSYRLPDVHNVKLGRPSDSGFYASPGQSVWVNGRYLGELAGSCPPVEFLHGEVTVEGRFRHLSFEIDRLV